jgi:hypothetical protein
MTARLSLVIGIIGVVVTMMLFAAGPIVADHQTLAFSSHHHSHGWAYGFYGPCICHTRGA